MNTPYDDTVTPTDILYNYFDLILYHIKESSIKNLRVEWSSGLRSCDRIGRFLVQTTPGA